MIKAVIFDLDGVLIDAKEWHYHALNRALQLFGLEISRYDHLITYDGLPTKKKLEMLSLERDLPTALHGFISRIKQQYTIEIVQSCCKPVFQHQYALLKLKQQGYKLAVASNAVHQSVKMMLEKASLSEYLEFYLSNEDVTNPKPHPEIYQKAIGLLGFSPEECLVVEDNINGVRAAVSSGARLLQVLSPQDVSIGTITNRISEIEGDGCA